MCMCVYMCVYVLKNFPGGSNGKNLSAKREAQVWSLGQADPLEKEVVPIPVTLPGELVDRGARWAIVYGISKSWTPLSE